LLFLTSQNRKLYSSLMWTIIFRTGQKSTNTHDSSEFPSIVSKESHYKKTYVVEKCTKFYYFSLISFSYLERQNVSRYNYAYSSRYRPLTRLNNCSHSSRATSYQSIINYYIRINKRFRSNLFKRHKLYIMSKF
jgi:hypothetical protein